MRDGAEHSADLVTPHHPVLGTPLSGREWQVVRLIGTGMTNAEISKHLHLSPNTVKTYVRNAYRKVGVDTRVKAVLWAVEHDCASGPPIRSGG